MLDCSAFLGLVLCCVIWGGVCWLRIAAGFVFALRLLVGCCGLDVWFVVVWLRWCVCFICCLLFVLDNSGFVLNVGGILSGLVCC